MSSMRNLKSRVLAVFSVTVFSASVAAVPFVATHSASAQTSGIITTDLALNLDPNLASSYAGSGSTVTDLSGNNRHGTLSGNTLPDFDSASPKSFAFTREWITNTTSTASKISVEGNFLTDNFTLQTWIKTSEVGYSTAHYTTMYIMASECGGGADDWGLGVNDSGKLAFGAGTSDSTFSTTNSVDTNEWVNVAASRDMTTGEIKLYINGVLEKTDIGNSGNSLTCSADGKTWIGNGQDAPAYSFGGKISSVLAYTKVLSASEILTNYNATVLTFYPVTYTISYNANGATSGSAPPNGSFTSGGSSTTVATNSGSLARTGFTFGGWNTAPDGTGTAFTAGSGTYASNANVTLYAMWTALPVATTTTQPPATVRNIQSSGSATSRNQQSVTNSPSTTGPVTTADSVVPQVTSTTSLAPPAIPQLSAGETALELDGVPSNIEVSREDNQLVIKSELMEAVVSSRDQNGDINSLDSDGNLHFVAGDDVALNLNGLEPGSDTDVWLFSTPKKLGTVQVASDGRMNGLFTVPSEVESGEHRIAIKAELPNGKSATFTIGIVVGNLANSSSLTRILIAVPIALAIVFGLILPNQLRRRRKKLVV